MLLKKFLKMGAAIPALAKFQKFLDPIKFFAFDAGHYKTSL